MKINEERIRDLLAYLEGLPHIEPENIPDIDLYMDRVTAFMEGHLKGMRRHPEDKVLTKTAINNYTKSNLFPPPVKKKYSKDYMLMLIFIYYSKSLLSFHNTEGSLHPITSGYFSGKDSPLPLKDIYIEVFTLEKNEMGNLTKDVTTKLTHSRRTFQGVLVDEKDKNYLQFFSFICGLPFDVYLKTQMIEMIADQLWEEDPPQRKKQGVN